MAVVLSADERQVLLLRREIFILWDFPGGKIERGESPAQAAIREALEETGYEIELIRPVGQYICQSVYGCGDQLTHVFSARVVGGKSKRFGFEVSQLRWFEVSKLPRGLQPLHRQVILDALAHASVPMDKRIDFPRWKLYPARVAFILVSAVSKSSRWLLRRLQPTAAPHR